MDSMLFVGLGRLKTPLRADMLTGIVRFWHCAAEAAVDKVASAVATVKKFAMSENLATSKARDKTVFSHTYPWFYSNKLKQQQCEAADRTVMQASWLQWLSRCAIPCSRDLGGSALKLAVIKTTSISSNGC